MFAKTQKLNGGDGQTVKGVKLSDLLYDFKHCEAFSKLSGHYQNKVPRPHTCAAMEGLISMTREGNKALTYQILDASQKIVLRPYQTDIIERASSAGGNVLIEAPTGSGKSVMAASIIKHETDNGGICLIVAPKITLLDQLAETFTDLEPQIIHGKKDYDSGHNVFVSTLQTAHKRNLGFEPSVILIDEIHFGFSGKMIEQLLKDFHGKLIGLSATPYDKQGKPLQGFDTHKRL